MGNSLYVNDDGLKNCIDALEKWQKEFNAINQTYLGMINKLNQFWEGEDYNAAKQSIIDGLKKITDENDGAIPKFVKDCISDLTGKVDAYKTIREQNRSYWEVNNG